MTLRSWLCQTTSGRSAGGVGPTVLEQLSKLWGGECNDLDVVLQVLVRDANAHSATVDVVEASEASASDQQPHLGTQDMLRLAVGMQDSGYKLLDVDVRNRAFDEFDHSTEAGLKSTAIDWLSRGSWMGAVRALTGNKRTVHIVSLLLVREGASRIEVSINRDGEVRVKPVGRPTEAVRADLKDVWLKWLTG